jgi:DnaJ-class molecular chaperone
MFENSELWNYLKETGKGYQWTWSPAQKHSEICPVCMGKGKIKDGVEEVPCHGCSGKGWIVV